MIAVIDYKAGNAPSVLHAVNKLGYEAVLARSPDDIADVTHIILPGVGSADATMNSLRGMGLIEPLEDLVLRRGVYFLGICVGLQVLFEHSEEGGTECLGWLGGRVVRFDDTKVRVPQMGWNRVDLHGGSVSADYFYFVNSYYAVPTDERDIWGMAEYNGKFAAAVRKGNIYATQFHVEKSGEAGLELLGEFLRLQGGGGAEC